MISIYDSVYKELDGLVNHNPKYNTKIARSVYDSLDREAIHDIILNDGVFWIEHGTYSEGMNSKQYKFLIRFLKQKGYRYLYED